MEQQNRNKQTAPSARKVRLGAQRLTISVCCLAMIVFFAVWAVNLAVKGKSLSTSTGTSSSSSQSDRPSSSKKEDTQQSSAAENTPSQTDVSADDTSSEEESQDGTDSQDSNDTQDSKDESSEQESEPDSSQPDDSSADDDTPDYTIVDDDFADAVFVGNSLTVGLQMNSDKPQATFYATTGLNVSTIATDTSILLDNGGYGTVYDALGQKSFSRVYVMFGINELGWPYPDVFQKEYETALNKIKELQPGAVVYVQSILPVSSLAQQNNIVFTNENVDKMNGYVKAAAENTGCVYLDVNSQFKDANGELPIDAATDGIHLKKDYCLKWINYLASVHKQ